MFFNSFEFALFLLVILSAYRFLNLRWQNVWLLVASYVFYGFWDWRFLLLIAFSTTVDYLIALRLHRLAGDGATVDSSSRASYLSVAADGEFTNTTAGSDSRVVRRRRKQLLILSLVCNLGLLGIFKYFNFFVDSFVLLGSQIGLQLDTPALRLLPPVGISFYTFQSMAYSIDVYRGKLKPERNYITFALYISYFPQLVAGPIERANRLLPQFKRPRVVTLNCIKSGIVLIFVGLFKKVVIADNAGVSVNRIFSDIENQASITLLAGAVLFTLQIYGDFSGYSNMARGMSRLLGIRLVENFKTPFLSANISEFWRRWHISLSEWLRDYLYIPLGGSRNGNSQTYRNLLLTMLLGGLWHGAAWTFVIWGALNGAYLVIHRWWSGLSKGRLKAIVDDVNSTQSDSQSQVKASQQIKQFCLWMSAVLVTYACVMFAFVVFRAPSLSDALSYLSGILAMRGGLPLHHVHMMFLLAALLAPIELVQYLNKDRLLAVRDLALPLRSLLYSLIVISLLLASSTDIPFIYFQF